ncbi:5953_t:CDS:2 [Paraglomus occultum]|uniref:5952_t:CDS:1 n=1 Tax=Paraglomus occultum TaxID=144539 RepID=A0A9N8ZE25_9GLOM|nr:5952_t:CDS:2 [Paraglomus occultum]CAG8487429.1 5953_t:CDS:2 [Paraglomus occultum]
MHLFRFSDNGHNEDFVQKIKTLLESFNKLDEEDFDKIYEQYIHPVVNARFDYRLTQVAFAALCLHVALLGSASYTEKHGPYVASKIAAWTINDAKLKVLTHIIRLLNIAECGWDIDYSVKTIEEIVETISLPSTIASWNGTISGVNTDNYSLTTTKVVFLDFLNVVCAYCSLEGARRLVKFFVRCYITSYFHDKEDDGYNLTKVCDEIVRNPKFYNFPYIKDVFFDLCTEELLFIGPRTTETPSTQFIETLKIFEILKNSCYQAIPHAAHLFTPTKNPTVDSDYITDSNFSSSSDSDLDLQSPNNEPSSYSNARALRNRMRAIIDLIGTIPAEHFNDRQKDGLILQAMFVEKIVDKKGLDISDTMQVCRRFIYKMMNNGSQGMLIYHPAYYIWWITNAISQDQKMQRYAKSPKYVAYEKEILDQMADIIDKTVKVARMSMRFLFQNPSSRYTLRYVNATSEFLRNLPIRLLSVDNFAKWMDDTIENLEHQWCLRLVTDFLEDGIQCYNDCKSLVTLSLFVKDQLNVALDCLTDKRYTEFLIDKFEEVELFLRALKIVVTYVKRMPEIAVKRDILDHINEKLNRLAMTILIIMDCTEDISQRVVENMLTVFSISVDCVQFSNNETASAWKLLLMFCELLCLLTSRTSTGIQSAERMVSKFIDTLTRNQFEYAYKGMINIIKDKIKENATNDLNILVKLIDCMIRRKEFDESIKKNLTVVIGPLCNAGYRRITQHTLIRLMNLITYICSLEDFSIRLAHIDDIITMLHALVCNYEPDNQTESVSIFIEVCRLLFTLVTSHSLELKKSGAIRLVAPTTYILLILLKGPQTGGHALTPKFAIQSVDKHTRETMAHQFRELLEAISHNLRFTMIIEDVPLILSEYISLLLVETRKSVRDILRPGTFALFDLCSKNEVETTVGYLSDVGEKLFGELWIEYNAKINM